jgi:hypothetical protein
MISEFQEIDEVGGDADVVLTKPTIDFYTHHDAPRCEDSRNARCETSSR